jgi:hypothetical protein
MLSRRGRILRWMGAKNRPILFSEAERELGIDFADEAFDGLIRHRVITAVFPEAKPGDSGRQFWDFANWVAL